VNTTVENTEVKYRNITYMIDNDSHASIIFESTEWPTNCI